MEEKTFFTAENFEFSELIESVLVCASKKCCDKSECAIEMDKFG